MRVGSLFSGIGGFELGLERAGMRVVWQSEIDPFASAVLRKHWPDVPNHGDIRNVGVGVGRVEVICGGFPCQPYSSAARGRNRSHLALWHEMRRVVAELEPRWVCAENVVGIGPVALEQVVSDLEALSYQVAPPLVIPACAVGHDHWRARYWIVGYADRNSEPGSAEHAEVARLPQSRDDPGGLGAAHGLPLGLDRMTRMRLLGNSLVPQIAETIGRAILDASPTERSLRRDASLGCGDSTTASAHVAR